ncbi:type II secretion system protein [Paenibacillus nanensis]|uniref:Type II secretion system protein n=1 Tax=Paenibacillus nanensis TaxID=393251 RepID=A0A3A1V025_9BACL|nr:type II secretion system protein [Paenibacillus nanensis]RIX54037.1 type II secretion system protein [Paenibacillus nanensis]
MKEQRLGGSESGFTLVEVIAAFAILAIVSLAMTAFFTNAMSYSKGNQDKTVMINLARNALFYMEKQDFNAIRKYFEDGEQSEIVCSPASCSEEVKSLVDNPNQLADTLTPTVNGVTYSIKIAYKENLLDGLDSQMENYLIPILVTVQPSEGSDNAREKAEVEGYITNEKIR